MKWAARFLSLVLSALVGLALVELGWRWLKLKRFTIEAGIEDPHFHHRLKPNQTYHFETSEFNVDIRTNRYGLRAPDPVIPKPAGVFRILMLGDSFTFGFPVRDDETFCHLIEGQLQARGYPVEVINAGVSGYSPTLEYISLRDQFLSFDPDLIMLWYDRGDLQEDYWFQKNLIYDETGRILRADPAYTNGRFDWWEWAKHHSVIAEYVDRKVLRTLKKIRILGVAEYARTKLRGERAKVAMARVKRAQQAEDLPMYDRFLLVRTPDESVIEHRYWPISARYIRMIRDLLAQRGIPLILGSYPYGMTVGPDQWAKGRVFWGFEEGKVYDSSPARNVMRRFCAEEGLPFISTFPSLRAAAATEKLYYDWDGHLTPAGHRVLAQHVVSDPQFLALLQQRLGRRLARSSN
jgi:hypothetical protein